MGSEEIDRAIHVECTDATAGTIQAVRQMGGTVTCYSQSPWWILQEGALRAEFKSGQPLAKPKEVLRMEKLRALGANVVYKKPQWFHKMEEEENELMSKQEQEYPFE